MAEANEGQRIVDRRQGVYGDPVLTHVRIAQVWSGILDHTVLPADVPLMMAGMKLVRAQITPDYSDNSDDVDGYVDIFRKVVGPDMIQASSVREYLEKKLLNTNPDRVHREFDSFYQPSTEDNPAYADIKAGHPQLPLSPLARYLSDPRR